jgi:DNA-binding MarR family transcriptional regulator
MISVTYNLLVSKDDAVPPLSTRGVFLLSQLGFHVASRCAEALAPLGLEPTHYGVLTHLTSHEGLSQQQLADAMGVHRNVMVGLIDELEERGLARRDRHPTDRRAHQLHLTDQAHTVLERANAAVDQLEEEIFTGLGPREHSRFVAMLAKAAKRAELPDSIHPGLRRRRRANVGDWRG